ncbi:MAG: Organic hydroperoxide resistance protein, partial [uncultured Solirubrobacteraceae bacterium]
GGIEQRDDGLGGRPRARVGRDDAAERGVSRGRRQLGVADPALGGQDEPRGAARGGACLVLLHGAVARARRGGLRARAPGGDGHGRLRARRGRQVVAARRDRTHTGNRSGGARRRGGGGERRLPDLRSAAGQRRDHRPSDARDI